MDVFSFLSAWHWSEELAVLFGLFYVILAARENIWCWFWGILSCALWAYATYALYELYIDAILQLFYVVMGFYGWYNWMQGQGENNSLPITTLSGKKHLLIIIGGVFLSVIVGYFFDEYTPAAATYLDAITTIFAIVTTFLVISKKLENWLYWVVIDAMYVYLYIERGGYPFAGLYVIYTLIAIFGYTKWRRNYQLQQRENKQPLI